MGENAASDHLPLATPGFREEAGKVWRASVLVQIANFVALRRQLGRESSDQLTFFLAKTVQRNMLGAEVIVVGRDLVEVRSFYEQPSMLSEEVAALQRAAGATMRIGDRDVALHLMIGAVTAQDDSVDAVGLVEEAERALDDAVRGHEPVVRVLDGDPCWTDRVTLARDLGRAIRDGELRLDYQPKLHLRRQEIVSLEALVRWQHPERGLIPPNAFIPVAEQSNDIAALTLWVIDRALEDQRRFAANGYDLPVFVNIAGMLLANTGFVTDASARVAGSAGKIGFEITETSALRDPAMAIANLRCFADLGIAIAIDDYGAGLSSLAYLKQLPACELKIDKLFVTQLASTHRDPLIVRSTIDLAHAMEMEVVAEGVETHAVLALLSVMGCDMAQGYLISRPLDASAMLAFLQEQGKRWFAESPAVSLLRAVGSKRKG